MKPNKYKVFNLYQIRHLMGNEWAYSRITGLPVRPERYYSIWNDIKLAWLVFRRKADAFIWEDNE